MVLSRSSATLVEVTTVSFWVSMDAIKAFAGDGPEQAKFYPRDDEFLVEKDHRGKHVEVVSADLDVDAMR